MAKTSGKLKLEEGLFYEVINGKGQENEERNKNFNTEAILVCLQTSDDKFAGRFEMVEDPNLEPSEIPRHRKDRIGVAHSFQVKPIQPTPVQAKRIARGDLCVYNSGENDLYEDGSIVVLESDDSDPCPLVDLYVGRITTAGDRGVYVDIDSITRLDDAKQDMKPLELMEMEVGDICRIRIGFDTDEDVIDEKYSSYEGGFPFSEGAIVQIVRDDGDDMPQFAVLEGECTNDDGFACEHLWNVEKLPAVIAQTIKSVEKRIDKKEEERKRKREEHEEDSNIITRTRKRVREQFGGIERTPAQRMGLSINDRVIVTTTDYGVEKGTIMKLVDDDKSALPRFEIVTCIDDRVGHCLFYPLSKVLKIG